MVSEAFSECRSTCEEVKGSLSFPSELGYIYNFLSSSCPTCAHPMLTAYVLRKGINSYTYALPHY